MLAHRMDEGSSRSSRSWTALNPPVMQRRREELRSSESIAKPLSRRPSAKNQCSAFAVVCLRMPFPFRHPSAANCTHVDLLAGGRRSLALDESCKALQPGKIHSRRERCSGANCGDPEQPLADAHLVPRVAPCREGRLQGRPE